MKTEGSWIIKGYTKNFIVAWIILCSCGGLKRPLKRRLDQQDALAVGKYFEDKTEHIPIFVQATTHSQFLFVYP